MPAIVLVGAQWGDEGKGKATDQLGATLDYCVRYQGGNNAGHTIVIMFPTDVPAGPTTTLYTGRVALRTSPAGVTTIVRESGRALDICAALTPAG